MLLKNDTFSFLKNYSTTPIKINRLIISNFLHAKNIRNSKNTKINRLLIKTEDSDFGELQEFINKQPISTFEQLIEAFEFVISPSDKIINGAIYTPIYIREYIIKGSLSRFNGDLNNIKTADIACGCGGFLLSLAQTLQQRTEKRYSEIYSENLFGIDIAEYSIERTKILLSLWAIMNGEDEEEFNFNLFVGNSLDFKWVQHSQTVAQNGGFDLIVGNPPYVASRNMDYDSLNLMQNWSVAKTGHPDLYIPFFQVGIENLNINGVLGYITVNTFIKSINGRALREYFAENNIDLTILNFGGEQVFKDRNTYTCICFLSRNGNEVRYIRMNSTELLKLKPQQLQTYNYQDLNNKDGWNLVNDQELLTFVNTVEKVGKSFKDLYDTKNGIATLKNNIYKFKPIREDETFYFFKDSKNEVAVEKEICRDIVNANKIKTIEDIERLKEKIIFPYDAEIRIYREDTMQKCFPMAYAYLETKKEILATRDKGKTKKYEAWYAYGRRQSLDINAYKLFFPHICEKPTFVICEDKDLLFYNGIAVISDKLDELLVLKKIMESEIFFRYIKNTTKDYASGYISMSRNYLKNFGVHQFIDDDQRKSFLEAKDVEELLRKAYGI